MSKSGAAMVVASLPLGSGVIAATEGIGAVGLIEGNAGREIFSIDVASTTQAGSYSKERCGSQGLSDFTLGFVIPGGLGGKSGRDAERCASDLPSDFGLTFHNGPTGVNDPAFELHDNSNGEYRSLAGEDGAPALSDTDLLQILFCRGTSYESSVVSGYQRVSNFDTLAKSGLVLIEETTT